RIYAPIQALYRRIPAISIQFARESGSDPTAGRGSLRLPGACPSNRHIIRSRSETTMNKVLGVHRASDPTPRAAGVPREINLARVSRHLVVGDFTASMAHEVRQPLTAIIANAETCLRMLRGTPEVDEIIAALTDIVDAGHRASQL